MIIRIVFAFLFLLTVPIRAVDLQQSAFRSTSAYRSSSLNQSPNIGMTTYNKPTGSLSAISAANFEALNSEGGACYSPGTQRRVRPEDGAIGEYSFESPIGDTPWFLIMMLSLLFYLYQRRHQQEK